MVNWDLVPSWVVMSLIVLAETKPNDKSRLSEELKEAAENLWTEIKNGNA